MNKEEQGTVYVVPEDWKGKRLDHFLTWLKPEKSRGYFQRLLARQLVKVNEKQAKASHLVKAGDLVMLNEPSLPLFPRAEMIPLDIIYEDEDILVVNKPAHMAVHPNSLEGTGTLVQALLYHSKSIVDAVYDIDSLVSRLRPGIVHRLDKDTSGLLVIAKSRESLEALANQFREHQVKKVYTALVYGSISQPVTIHTNLKRKPGKKKSIMGISAEEGREAITHITPQRSYYYPKHNTEISLVKCEIVTGRTHQIRVHCKYSGHPVIGDSLYTHKPAREASLSLGARRQLLHASYMCFQHPRHQQTLEFKAELPEDMQSVISRLEGEGSFDKPDPA